jgi:hypothetical protein
MGFEPMFPVSQEKRLAGARTRPLCDPSSAYTKYSRGLPCLQPPAYGFHTQSGKPMPLKLAQQVTKSPNDMPWRGGDHPLCISPLVRLTGVCIVSGT